MLIFFLWHVKFWGQKCNSHHSSDNVESLAARPRGNSLYNVILKANIRTFNLNAEFLKVNNSHFMAHPEGCLQLATRDKHSQI